MTGTIWDGSTIFDPVISLLPLDSNLSGKSHCRFLNLASAKFQVLLLLPTVSSWLTNFLLKMLNMTLDICSAAVSAKRGKWRAKFFFLYFLCSTKHDGKRKYVISLCTKKILLVFFATKSTIMEIKFPWCFWLLNSTYKKRGISYRANYQCKHDYKRLI